MIRVRLNPDFSMQPREFENADGWIIDTDSGYLTVTSSNMHVASFAPGSWIYAEQVGVVYVGGQS
jgi:hypothetical protein